MLSSKGLSPDDWRPQKINKQHQKSSSKRQTGEGYLAIEEDLSMVHDTTPQVFVYRGEEATVGSWESVNNERNNRLIAIHEQNRSSGYSVAGLRGMLDEAHCMQHLGHKPSIIQPSAPLHHQPYS